MKVGVRIEELAPSLRACTCALCRNIHIQNQTNPAFHPATPVALTNVFGRVVTSRTVLGLTLEAPIDVGRHCGSNYIPEVLTDGRDCNASQSVPSEGPGYRLSPARFLTQEPTRIDSSPDFLRDGGHSSHQVPSHVRKSTLLAKRLKIVSADISREELPVREAFEAWGAGAPRTASCGQAKSNGNKGHDRTIRPELRLPSKVPLYMAP
jgi:hypothetical protein